MEFIIKGKKYRITVSGNGYSLCEHIPWYAKRKFPDRLYWSERFEDVNLFALKAAEEGGV